MARVGYTINHKRVRKADWEAYWEEHHFQEFEQMREWEREGVPCSICKTKIAWVWLPSIHRQRIAGHTDLFPGRPACLGCVKLRSGYVQGGGPKWIAELAAENVALTLMG